MFKAMKNAYGTIRGYGCCPNCGDNWGWKPHGDITYQEFDDGTASGVILCCECLSSPQSLDLDRIATKLTKHYWQPTDVELVKSALANLKHRAA